MLHYVGSVHARSLTRAHTCTVMYMSTGRFLYSPVHDCICKSAQSVQYCMADTIASDTGRGVHQNNHPMLMLNIQKYFKKIIESLSSSYKAIQYISRVFFSIFGRSVAWNCCWSPQKNNTYCAKPKRTCSQLQVAVLQFSSKNIWQTLSLNVSDHFKSLVTEP